MVLRFFILASTFFLAFCSVPERDNPNDPDGVNYQEYVVIGTQTWQKRNLNYEIEGSKCYEDSPAYCAKYGRLYTWATAMALPSYCNDSICANLIKTQHRGICPEGWHIPSYAEWNTLMKFVNPSCSDITINSCDGAGRKLKATSGWYGNGNVPGTDDFGFSALPGGAGGINGNFSEVGNRGDWWSSSEPNFGSHAFEIVMSYSVNYVGGLNSYKSGLLSVRCLKDYSTAGISSSSITLSSSSVQPNIVYGSPVDYEYETYKTVVIGTQTWFQRNLNYPAENGKCYENCDTYGRLYDWATAMALPDSCNSVSCASKINAKHQGICPSGWHIPSGTDWNILMKFVNPNCEDNSGCVGAATKLKSTNLWKEYNFHTYDGYYSIPLGTDFYGFSALPGGTGNISNGVYSFTIGEDGQWWSTSLYLSDAYSQSMSYRSEDVSWGHGPKNALYSVRCIKD